MKEHSPTPWTRNELEIVDANGDVVAEFDFDFDERRGNDLDFAVVAVNSHDALVAACNDILSNVNSLSHPISLDELAFFDRMDNGKLKAALALCAEQFAAMAAAEQEPPDA